jgi:hypothetical protein
MLSSILAIFQVEYISQDDNCFSYSQGINMISREILQVYDIKKKRK